MPSKRTSSVPPERKESSRVRFEVGDESSPAITAIKAAKIGIIAILLICLADYYFFDGITHDIRACKTATGCNGTVINRMALHQGQSEATIMYYFVSHVYNFLVAPWQWTDEMRNASLATHRGSRWSLSGKHDVLEVGTGTGLFTKSLLQHGVRPESLWLVDQSHTALMYASVRSSLAEIPREHFVIGDAEALPTNWTRKFSRYVSAGVVQYLGRPQFAFDEAIRVLRPGGQALFVGPVRATYLLESMSNDACSLWPTKYEYEQWMNAAGFEDVHMYGIQPWWFDGEKDRGYGVPMGIVVTGSRPEKRRASDRVQAYYNTRIGLLKEGNRLERADREVEIAASRAPENRQQMVGVLLKESFFVIFRALWNALTTPTGLVRAIVAPIRGVAGCVPALMNWTVPIWLYVRNRALLMMGL